MRSSSQCDGWIQLSDLTFAKRHGWLDKPLTLGNNMKDMAQEHIKTLRKRDHKPQHNSDAQQVALPHRYTVLYMPTAGRPPSKLAGSASRSSSPRTCRGCTARRARQGPSDGDALVIGSAHGRRGSHGWPAWW